MWAVSPSECGFLDVDLLGLWLWWFTRLLITVWGGGWLGEMGLLDFAGGTVVHHSRGRAVVAAIVMGPRQGPPQLMPPHNMTMTITGAGLLWVGWFGFNAGSALAANGDAGMAMLVTHISAPLSTNVGGL